MLAGLLTPLGTVGQQIAIPVIVPPALASRRESRTNDLAFAVAADYHITSDQFNIELPRQHRVHYFLADWALRLALREGIVMTIPANSSSQRNLLEMALNSFDYRRHEVAPLEIKIKKHLTAVTIMAQKCE
jgi:hypothetical protein